jgi:hypothetical protein
VAHAYNPSSSGDRDQEDQGSKSTPGKQFLRHYLAKTHHKKGLVVWLRWQDYLPRKCEARSSNHSVAKKYMNQIRFSLLKILQWLPTAVRKSKFTIMSMN